ncbi:hypothetical protein PVAP13_8NG095600 [Panicum virgatum]|uniref:C2 domain-containing protein n=1 Tax=Panicum virgatum TaxID=38727 RepID=A0A8T0PCD6_PANVG|nr:hypothetical protein PVAP13_8NG095600 [Panicum virgatum]
MVPLADGSPGTCPGSPGPGSAPGEKNPNPEWRQTFAFSIEHLPRQLEVVVKDKDVLSSEFVGHVVFDMADVPERQVAPQWYRLAHRNGDKLHRGEIMLAIWTGVQAEDACCHSDAHHSGSTEGLANRRSKD